MTKTKNVVGNKILCIQCLSLLLSLTIHVRFNTTFNSAISSKSLTLSILAVVWAVTLPRSSVLAFVSIA